MLCRCALVEKSGISVTIDYSGFKDDHSVDIKFVFWRYHVDKLCGRPPQYAPAPCKLTFDLLTFDLKSGVRVTCDVGYLCANFSLPRPLST